jgi:hypothetical protein
MKMAQQLQKLWKYETYFHCTYVALENTRDLVGF